MKKVLITGSSSGIGQAIAQRLLSENYSIVGLARQPERSGIASDHFFPFSIDFSKVNVLEEEFKAIRRQHPDTGVLICCAGYGHFVELEQFSFAEMTKLLQVNFLSQALLVKTFIPQLKKMNHSKIIFIGSESALVGQKKGTMYCASKFALRGFAESLRQECRAAQIAVTVINPGMVDTPFFDKLNFKPGDDFYQSIRPEQVAEIVFGLLKLENNCVVEEINCQQMKKVIVSSR